MVRNNNWNNATINKNINSHVKDSASVSDLFVKNCRTALRSVIMPSSEEELVEFLTGTPPDLSSRQQEEADDELEDEEKDEGPPKAKRSKRELKALTVRSLQVSLAMLI